MIVGHSHACSKQPRWNATQSHSNPTPSESGDDDDSGEETPHYRGESRGNPAPNSIEIVIAPGSRYILLKQQSARVVDILRKAFELCEYQIAFRSPYPDGTVYDKCIREILLSAAEMLEDEDMIARLRTDARYGNTLGQLVCSFPYLQTSKLTSCYTY